jgi:hypothetical protein
MGLVVPFFFHTASMDQMPGFPGKDLPVLEKFRIIHAAFRSNHDIELIKLLGFFLKIGCILTSLGVVIVEHHPIASQDRRSLAGDLDRWRSFSLLALMTLTAALVATASASTAATATITIAIPMMTGSLLLIGTSVQISSCRRPQSTRPSMTRSTQG